MVSPLPLKAALRNTARRLGKITDSDSARFEAMQLLRTLGFSTADIVLGEALLSREQQEKLSALLARRLKGKPLQYLLGEWDFYGMSFFVGPGVLIPRADTETLVEVGLSFLRTRQSARVLDLCAGTGCVGLAVEQNAKLSALYELEKSKKAFAYLQENAARHQSKARLLLADGTCPGAEPTDLDLILCNPPYVSERDLDTLQTEVRFEPRSALDGGKDGLDFYRALTRAWTPRLTPGGMLAYEIGAGQEREAAELLRANGLSEIRTKKDLNGITRVVCGKRIEQNK